MELKADLSKPSRARVLHSVGKRTRGRETNESDLADSFRDFGSVPPAQTTMGGCETPYCAANRLQRRTGASSAIASFASNAPSETARFSRRGTAAFSYRMRRFAPSNCSAYRPVELPPFAASCPTHQARTRNCATCLRRTKRRFGSNSRESSAVNKLLRSNVLNNCYDHPG